MFQLDVYITSPNVILLGVITSLLVYLYSRKPGHENLPEGPKGIPFLGNVSILSSKCPAKAITKLKETYGALMSLKMVGFQMVVIQDYKTMKEAFVEKGDKTSWRHVNLLPGAKNTFNEPGGIALNVGEDHKVMRRFILNALRDFGVGKQSLESKVSEETRAITEMLLDSPSSLSSDELRSACQRGLSNVIISICFGHRYDYGDEELEEILANIGSLLKINPFAQPSIYFPMLRHLPFLGDKLDLFSELERKVVEFVQMKVQQHRDTFDPVNIRDLTDLYLKEEANVNVTDVKFSTYSLFRSIVDLFMAGTETTATTLSWIIFFMAKHPDVQQKMYEEITKVIGNRPPTYRDHQDMPFVSAVLLESWRLGNIVPFGLPHTTSEDVILRGKFIPKNTLLLPNIYAIHMNEEYWDNPEMFQPERFLDSSGNIKRHEEFVPFSIGPRACVGEHLARMETFLFLTHFVQTMEFGFSDLSKDYGDADGIEALTRQPPLHDIIIKSR